MCINVLPGKCDVDVTEWFCITKITDLYLYCSQEPILSRNWYQWVEKILQWTVKISAYFNYYYHGKYSTTAFTKTLAHHIADENLLYWQDSNIIDLFIY